MGQNSFLGREHLEAFRALEAHIQNGGRHESFPGRLQTSPDAALVSSAVWGLPSAVEDQEAQEELVAADVSHLNNLLSSLTKAAGGPALEAGHELSTPWPEDTADACLRRHGQIDSLAADPTPGDRTLHTKPQNTAESGPGLVFTD